MATLAIEPLSDLAGSHQLNLPLAVDATTFEPIDLIGVDVAGYTLGNSSADGTQSALLTQPDVGVIGTGQIDIVSTAELTYADAYGTSWNFTLGATAVLEDDLIIMDVVTQESTDPGAPDLPTDFTLQGSWYSASPNNWIPRHTRYYRWAAGGEENDVINVTHGTSTRLHGRIIILRGVDTDNPFPTYPASGHFTGAPNPNAISGVEVGDFVLETVSSNVFPDGADSFDTSDVSAGYTVAFNNTPEPRFIVDAYKIATVEGSEDPAGFGSSADVFENWSSLTAVIRPRAGNAANVTCVIIAAVTDETATTETGIAANIPTVSEVQQIQSDEASGTVQLTFRGQQTAAIAFDAAASAVDTALEALSTIGTNEVFVSGGPLDENPVTVQFAGTLGSSDQPLLSTADAMAITETQKGSAGFTYTLDGSINIPQAGAAYTPQIHIWSGAPTSYVAGEQIEVTVSDHDTNHSLAAVLLVFNGADIADVVYGTFSADTEGDGQRASFGSLTPDVAGSRLVAILAKASSSLYTVTRTPNAPVGLTAAAGGRGDAITLDAFLSPAVAAGLQEVGDAAWAGDELWATGVISVRPASGAGSLGLYEALAAGEDAYVDIAGVSGSMYEVIEMDLTGLPADSVITGASATISHQSSARNALRVEIVGITATGEIVRGGEIKPGGYFAEPVGETQTFDTGLWSELSDGSHLSDYDRIGVALFSTARVPDLTYHRVFSVSTSVEFVEGGPVVSSVAGPTTAGEAITWEYSSRAGLAQTHSQVRVIDGFGQDPADTYETQWFEEFQDVGNAADIFADPASVELYNSAGNAGYGLRRDSQITVYENAAQANSGDNLLRIDAVNGTGADAGLILSGGLKFLDSAILYGQFEVRYRASGDPDNIFSPVILAWPVSNQWPRDGEIDIIENFANRDTLSPIEFHLHRLKLGAVEPYDSSDDEELGGGFPITGVTGTNWTKALVTWAPGFISVDYNDGSFTQTITSDELWIPDDEMVFTVQLDQWADGPLTALNEPWMEVDYMLTRRVVNQVPAIDPLSPAEGEIVYDSGKVPGSLTREKLVLSSPIGSGNLTAAVRSWARLPSGIEVASEWDVDSFDIPGNPPTVSPHDTAPVFNAATGGVDLSLVVPANVSRAWLSRSVDSGETWELVGPFDVSESSTPTVSDYTCPLAGKARYRVAYDDGGNTESTESVPVGGSDAGSSGVFSVSPDAEIVGPDGVEYIKAGMNHTSEIVETNSWATNARTAWNHDGLPQFRLEHDVWADTDNDRIVDGEEVFPASNIIEHLAFSASASEDAVNYPSGAYVTIPDRAAALIGNLTDEAAALGVVAPTEHWHTPIIRLTCFLTNHAETYSAADALTRTDTVPQYIANIQAMEALGLTPVPQVHAFGGTDLTLDAAWVADPDLAVGSIPTSAQADVAYFFDELVANADPAKTWIALPNEFSASARDSDYDDVIVTMIRRIRNAGWTGIISVPMANYSAELGPMALGEYDSLMDTLDTYGYGWGLVWEWHMYGAHVHTGEATTVYTYDEVDEQLTTVREGTPNGRKYAVWMAEYGQPVPNYIGTGSERANEVRIREAVLIMATDTYGEALAVKHPHVNGSWWNASGDDAYASTYSLTYGLSNKGDDTGADPVPSSNTNPGTFPYHDVTTPALAAEWLTEGGQAHRNMAIAIDGLGQLVESDVSTDIEEWYLIVPADPSLNFSPDVAAIRKTQGYGSVAVDTPGGSLVATSPALAVTMDMTVRARSKEQREAIEAILASGHTVRIVDILGIETWVKLAGDVDKQLQRWQPVAGETTGLRDAHMITIPWHEVSAPTS